jgi:hypothetical protein
VWPSCLSPAATSSADSRPSLSVSIVCTAIIKDRFHDVVYVWQKRTDRKSVTSAAGS